MNKEELRELYKQIRLRMTRSEASSKSRLIDRKLLQEIDWTKYQNLCVFQPIGRLNEVDITGVVSRLAAQDKKITVLGRSRNIKLPEQQFDLIIVPCLAFDKDNYRLGWGSGFYDKFLAQQTRAFKVGVCFQNGFIESGVPHEAHDIALDSVMTEV